MIIPFLLENTLRFFYDARIIVFCYFYFKNGFINSQVLVGGFNLCESAVNLQGDCFYRCCVTAMENKFTQMSWSSLSFYKALCCVSIVMVRRNGQGFMGSTYTYLVARWEKASNYFIFEYIYVYSKTIRLRKQHQRHGLVQWTPIGMYQPPTLCGALVFLKVLLSTMDEFTHPHHKPQAKRKGSVAYEPIPHPSNIQTRPPTCCRESISK